MTRSRTWFGVVVLAAIAAMATATPVPVLRAADLERDADVIVIGYADRIDDVGPASVGTSNGTVFGRNIVASVVVDQAVKGQTPNLVTVQFFMPEEPMGYASITPDSAYRMFFLKGTASPFTLTSPYYASLPAARGNALTGKEPADRVFEALGAVAVSPSAAMPLRSEAMHALSGSQNAFAVLSLRAAANDDQIEIRVSAIAGLLMSGDMAMLQSVLDMFNAAGPGAPDATLTTLAMAISQGIRVPEAIPALGILLKSDNLAGRQAAADALRHIKSEAAIRPLIQALGDDDREVRYTAVAALAEITGQTQWLPSMEKFWSNEAPYIAHWRARERQ